MPEQEIFVLIADFDNISISQRNKYGWTEIDVIHALRQALDDYQQSRNAREVAAEILNDFVWSDKQQRVADFHLWASDLGFVLIHCPPLQNGSGARRDSVDDHIKDRLEFYHDNFGSKLTIILATSDGNFVRTANNLKRRRGHRLVLMQNRNETNNALLAIADQVIYLEYGKRTKRATDEPQPITEDATETISDGQQQPEEEVVQEPVRPQGGKLIRPANPGPRPSQEDQDVTPEVIRGQIWPRLFNKNGPEGDFETRITSIRADFSDSEGQEAIDWSLEAVRVVSGLQQRQGKNPLTYNMVLDELVNCSRVQWDKHFCQDLTAELGRHNIIETTPQDASHSYRLNNKHPLVKHLS
jgi:hypothetical protein